MAALRIAFEAPDTPGSSSLSGKKPIDFAHLAAQTMGDKALEIEVLQLFARQARKVMKEITDGDVNGRAQAAHQLKGPHSLSAPSTSLLRPARSNSVRPMRLCPTFLQRACLRLNCLS